MTAAIPYHYQQDEQRMQRAIRILTDWHELRREHFTNDFEFSIYRLLVDCLNEMVCS